MRCTCADKGDLGRHLAGLSALALLAVACATSATGRKQLLLMPDDEVRGMGEQAFVNVKKESPAAQEPVTNAYVQCVVGALLQVIGAKASDWEVVVFEDDSANAFALPGGKVGVYTGIFKVATTQDQLAGVISHEIGHVISRHHEERITRQMGAQGAVQVLGALLGSRYGEGIGSAAMQGGSVLAQTGFLLPGSREQETEADVVGQQLMAQAGFDPRGAVALWTNMIAASNGSRPPQWLSTHPNPESRIRELQQRAASLVPVYEQARAAGRRPSCG